MTDMIGMDVEAVRRIAAELRRKAGDVRAIDTRVNAIVGQIDGNWQGNRARQFVYDWQNHHRNALRLLADRIEGLGQSALNNAAEQEDASRGGSASHSHGEAPRKGVWDKGVGGFLNGAGSTLWDTVTGAGNVVSMAWDGDKRSEFAAGVSYAWQHPGEALDALWGDVSSREDREAGNYAKAAGGIGVEVLGLFLAPTKISKLSKLHAVSEAAKHQKVLDAGAARTADRAADTAERRLVEGPRWNRGEVPWQPTGAAPGRWADPTEFKTVVVDPADGAAQAARLQAFESQRSFIKTNLDFYGNAVAPSPEDIVIQTDNLVRPLAERRDPAAAGGGGW